MQQADFRDLLKVGKSASAEQAEAAPKSTSFAAAPKAKQKTAWKKKQEALQQQRDDDDSIQYRDR